MKKVKGMAIYAHPADPISDCGGTLALHAERGDDTTSVVGKKIRAMDQFVSQSKIVPN